MLLIQKLEEKKQKLSRDMVEAIRNAGGSPRYTEFTGAGHLICNEVNGYTLFIRLAVCSET